MWTQGLNKHVCKDFLPHRLFIAGLRLSKAFLDICVAKFWRVVVYFLDFAGTLFLIFNLRSFGLIFAVLGVNFINIVLAALERTDPNAQKDTDGFTVFFVLSGSDCGKCWWNWRLGSRMPYGQPRCSLC